MGYVPFKLKEHQDADVSRVVRSKPWLKEIYRDMQGVPNGVLCMFSALEVQLPTLPRYKKNETGRVWIAIDRKSRAPRNLPEHINLVWFSEAALEAGKERVLIEGVGTIHIHNEAKAIVDCFKMRNKTAAYKGGDEKSLLVMLNRLLGVEPRSVLYVSRKQIEKYLDVCRMRNILTKHLVSGKE